MTNPAHSTNVRISPEDIIALVLEEMEAGIAPSHYTNLVPSVFGVYLYAEDLDRLRPLESRMRDEAIRALSARIAELNKPGSRIKIPLISDRGQQKRYEALGDWVVEFHENTDDDAAENALVVVSSFPRQSERGEAVGTLTERVTRKGADGNTNTTTATQRTSDLDTRRATGILHANITYEDATGAHTFQMTRDSIKIGRGAVDRWVDLKLGAQKDISREHLLIRRDAATAKFFIKDLSTLGTTVNGKRIPPSIETSNGQEIDRNIEVPLPDKARIGLAGVLDLEFRAVR